MADEMNLKELAANLAAKAYNDIDQGEGNFDNNIKLLRESVKLVAELDKAEQETKTEEEKSLENRKMVAEIDKINSEAARSASEARRIDIELAQQKKDKFWDRSLKIAAIAVPATCTVLTGIGTLILFKQKCDFTTQTLKLNTLLEEKGLISGISSSRTINNMFNDLITKK